jgi:hypothetical protein
MSKSRKVLEAQDRMYVRRGESLKLLAYDIHTYFTAVHVNVLMLAWMVRGVFTMLIGCYGMIH